MNLITQLKLDAFTAMHGLRLHQAITGGKKIDDSIWTYLQQSEEQLTGLMNGNPPGPNAPGSMEFSWCLYVLNNDIGIVWTEILRLAGMPKSQIVESDWLKWVEEITHNGVIMGDGSLVSTALYAIADPGWIMALIFFFWYEIFPEEKHAANFTPTAITVPSTQAVMNIGLFGDWGTGNYTDGTLPSSASQMVTSCLAAANTDMLIHLGDVYYAGTGATLIDSNEELDSLLNCWPNKDKGGSGLGNFTMNSNHEMYDGANGLYTIALASPLFAKQNNSTVFSITYGEWLILGLDSAYNAEGMYMNGRITDAQQLQLLKTAGASGKKIMILTHHNGISEPGDAKEQLWSDVTTALGKAPDYWYWGHVHNAIVYSNTSAGAGSACRCLGNAAIPIGNAPWFENNSNVDFFTNKPVNATYPGNDPLRVQNGYAILTFTPDGGLVETWCNMDGTEAWTSVHK